MDKKVLDYVMGKTEELLAAPTSCAELKASAENWLAAIGTDAEKDATKAYIKEMEEDIMPIDGLIGFAGSEQAKSYFGEEKAKQVYEHAVAIKAKGAKYCDCPGCKLCEEILAKKEEMI